METSNDPGTLQADAVVIRTLQAEDVQRVVDIDAQATGHRRPEYFELMLRRALEKSTLHVSLVAELDGSVVGFVIGSVYYGEFGVVEPSATIDAIGVALDFRGRSVGCALLRQLKLNLGALRIVRIRTEVAWDDFDLLAFFKREGFTPSNRLCLETQLDPTAPSHATGTDGSLDHGSQ